MLKVLIGVLLLAIVISLFSGLFFLVKDGGKGKRVVHSLALRVALAAALVILILVAMYTGDLQLNPSPIRAF